MICIHDTQVLELLPWLRQLDFTTTLPRERSLALEQRREAQQKGERSDGGGGGGGGDGSGQISLCGVVERAGGSPMKATSTMIRARAMLK